MRKLLAICAALILGASVLSAQEFNPTGRWYVSLQGGPMYQSNENTFAYAGKAMVPSFSPTRPLSLPVTTSTKLGGSAAP